MRSSPSGVKVGRRLEVKRRLRNDIRRKTGKVWEMQKGKRVTD